MSQKIDEFELINGIREMFPRAKPPVKLGIGDDCAILHFKDKEILVSSDLLIENTHFLIPPFKPYELGKKAILANISDISAMGGIPEAFTVSLGLPPTVREREVKELYLGIKEASSNYRCQLVGGDISRSERFTISITIVGSNEKDGSILRSTASCGDLLCVTGKPGCSAIGLEALLKGYPPPVFLKYIKHHIEPSIKIPFARGLSILKAATSMIDISDGIASDARRIAEASGVRVVIEREKLPSLNLKEDERAFLEKEEAFYILHGGEDYELLFTVRPEKLAKVKQIAEETQTEFTVIGFVDEGEGVYIKENGEIKPLSPEGFKHF